MHRSCLCLIFGAWILYVSICLFIGLVCTLILCKALRSGMICPVTGGLFAHDLWYIDLICMSVLFGHRPCVGLVCTSTPVVKLGRQYAVEDTSEIVGLVWALSRYTGSFKKKHSRTFCVRLAEVLTSITCHLAMKFGM